MAQLKTEAPVFREDEDLTERIRRLAGFAAQLRQELDFVLGHLGGGNINSTGLSLTVTNGGGDVLGSMGQCGGGVGLSAGSAAVTAEAGAATMACGGVRLRVTEAGAQISADGGETWRTL